MNKFNNYVFLSICEITVKSFDGSHYTTYLNYCNGLLSNIRNHNLSKKQSKDLVKIFNELKLIYSIDGVEGSDFILDFLESNRIIEFYECVRMTNRFLKVNHFIIM